MPRVVIDWLADHVRLPSGLSADQLAATLVEVGIEEEAIHRTAVSGPLVVGNVVAKTGERQKNGKLINWCLVDVGQAHNDPGLGARGVVCGADNFQVGDLVVVALPGTTLPGGFEISARKTYGHLSDGMICSTSELGLGDDHSGGIIVLPPETTAPPGASATELLGLGTDVLEVNLTPDRGYEFSYRGIGREYALATGAPFTDRGLGTSLPSPIPATSPNAFEVVVADGSPIHGRVGCDRFVTRIVRDIDPLAASPHWLTRRLEASGMRAISLTVDVTNYVMLDLGQPLHAYDLHQVAAPIVVRRADSLGYGPGERLTTLDDVERRLDPEDLLITDSPEGRGSRVLGLAGVMGGASSEVTAQTVDVLIEAAHFDPVTVARTARRHKLPTEAAKRFERGVDPLLPPVAAQRVVDLLVEYGGGRADPAVGDLCNLPPAVPIKLPLSLPERVVGVPYQAEQVVSILERIGCRVTPDGATAEVVPPSWRPDLVEPVDLVEEVARIAGYALIPSVLPPAPGGRGLTHEQRTRRSVARALAEAGLVEVLSYPFVGPDDADLMGAPLDDPRRQAVRLANPLAEERAFLRTNLIITLLDTARRNVSRGLDDVGIFEIGLVTIPGAEQPVAPVPPLAQLPTPKELAALDAAVPHQPRHVAAVLAGRADGAGWWGTGRVATWADAIGLAHLVADRAGVPVRVEREPDLMPWHPGRRARLVVDGSKLGVAERDGIWVGVAGELHPQVVERLGLPARTVAFEVDLSALEAAAPTTPIAAKPISSFPPAKEDFAFVVDNEVSAETLREAVLAGASDLVEEVTLFDVFTGEQVGAGKKSLAYSVRLRAPDRTLNAEDVRAAREGIVAAAARVGATLRA